MPSFFIRWDNVDSTSSAFLFFRRRSNISLANNPSLIRVSFKARRIFDFALDRALREISDYSCRLNIDETNPEKKVGDFIHFLPVLAYDGSTMTAISASDILDITMAGTSATLLARRWESALLVNVDNETLARLLANDAAMKAISNIEGFRALNKAIQENRMGRALLAEREIDLYLEREASAGLLMDMQQKGELPLRVTHNDTKLNNVMLDMKTREPLCILDLDTVMPGIVASDFGDAIRFGASTALEDETDLNKVHLDLTLFEAFTRGFLGACGKALTRAELETLADAARLITLEIGARFLTDYLEGDIYFHTTHPEHNLERARTQIALVMENEKYESRIREMILRVRAEEEV